MMFVRPAALAALILPFSMGAQAQTWDRWPPPPSNPPGLVHPQRLPYGPGAYTENDVVVYVPANCYVSREQTLRNGRLVWRPLKVCPSPGDR